MDIYILKTGKYLICFCVHLLYFLRIVHGQSINLVAGNGATGFNGDKVVAVKAFLNYPAGITVDAKGNLFFADTDNNRIRMVYLDSLITTVAGSQSFGFSGDEGKAINAGLNSPRGVAVDRTGNLFIADMANRRVRKVSSDGIITTFAGSGAFGNSGDEGKAVNAKMISPIGVAVDNLGNVFIADYDSHCVRKVSSSGIITTVAGTSAYGFSGDGGMAKNAALFHPSCVTVDTLGNLFIVDQGNHRIRKVSVNGNISTVAGSKTPGFSGDGGSATNAQLNTPHAIAVDVNGNLFITDTGNQRIRKVSADGIITTVAGSATYGFRGDGGTATSASLFFPFGIAVDRVGNLFIADSGNQRIRKVSVVNPVLSTSDFTFTAFPTASNKIDLNWTVARQTASDYFQLERSKDKVETEALVRIKAHERNSELSYTYTDQQPFSGRSYYRLIQIDQTGHREIHPWVSVLSGNPKYGVYPNPSDGIVCTLELDDPQTAKISLNQLDGVTIHFQKLSHQNRNLQIKLLSPLPAGIYILRVEERGEYRQYRLIVQ